MKANKMDAIAGLVASTGGYGFETYDTSSEKEYEPTVDGRIYAAIQAFEATTVKEMVSLWDAPAELDNVTIPAGTTVYLRATSVTITDGSGILYYGIG